jgi:hypothetical protein
MGYILYGIFNQKYILALDGHLFEVGKNVEVPYNPIISRFYCIKINVGELSIGEVHWIEYVLDKIQ